MRGGVNDLANVLNLIAPGCKIAFPKVIPTISAPVQFCWTVQHTFFTTTVEGVIELCLNKGRLMDVRIIAE